MKNLKKIFIIIYAIFILILLKLIISFLINESFISKYNSRIYNSEDVKGLFILNVFEPYTAHYNNGNILYYNNDFEGAIEEYEKALKMFPPKDKEIDIKINLELAKARKENTSSDENSQSTDTENKEDNPKEKEQKKDEIEKQLKEIQKESEAERKDSLDQMQRLDGEYEYYSGKRW